MFYVLIINDIRYLVFEFAKRRGINNPFNKEKCGRQRFCGKFLKRNATLSLRKPEGLSIKRVVGLNRNKELRS